MSSQPARFLVTTDYRTLKRETFGAATASTTIPGSTAIAGSGTWSWSKDIEAGSKGSINQAMIASSVNNRGYHYVSTINFSHSGTVSGSPATYSVLCYVSRVSATTIRCSVLIKNPYGSTLTTQPTNDLILFAVALLIPPYE